MAGLWGIVNNAGRALPMGPSEWMQIEDFQGTLRVNMTGVIETTINFLPLVKKARGRIVNVASVLGRVAANGGGYCISKFAVESFSDCLRYFQAKSVKSKVCDNTTMLKEMLKHDNQSRQTMKISHNCFYKQRKYFYYESTSNQASEQA